MEQEYVLRLYDTDLLSFSLSEQGIEGLKSQIHSVKEENKALFPLDLELTDDGLVKWLQRRVIPKNRAYVAEILKTFGLSINDTKGIIDVCKGLSLNDSYWVCLRALPGHLRNIIYMKTAFLRFCRWWPIPASDRATQPLPPRRS